MAQEKRKIRSIQLTQRFYFGTTEQNRFNQNTGTCQLTEEKDHILLELLIHNDNSLRTYRIPLNLCVIEYI